MDDGGLEDAVVLASQDVAQRRAADEKQREAAEAEGARIRDANRPHYERAMQAARACAQRARAAKIPTEHVKWISRETVEGIFGKRVRERKRAEKLWILRGSHYPTREEASEAGRAGWYLTVDGRLLQGSYEPGHDYPPTSLSDFSPYDAELTDELVRRMANLLTGRPNP